jgi:hypothetical protein
MVGLCLVLAGCTTWVKPGATEAMRDAQMARCEAAAYRQAPSAPVVVMVDSGGFRPPERSCWRQRGQTVCRITPGYFAGPTYGTQDANGAARDAFFQDCMFRDGWTQE